MTEPLLEIRDLRFGPAGVALTDPVSFAVVRGGVVAVLGPNGAGKTSLFRTVLGLLPPLGGEVRWAGRPLAGLSPRELAEAVAYVPQAAAAAFDFTVEHYVLLGRLGRLRPISAPGRVDREAAAAAIERLGLGGFRQRLLSRMSGGERQLAAVARALAQQARVLVLDEPTASLDFGNQARVLDLLAGLAADGLAVVFSTHDPNHALRAGEDALLFTRDGPVVAGPAADVLTPERLSRAYGTPVEAARTARGRLVLTAVFAAPRPAPSSETR
jgi:iron complex transport system ATP-binding protein